MLRRRLRISFRRQAMTGMVWARSPAPGMKRATSSYAARGFGRERQERSSRIRPRNGLSAVSEHKAKVYGHCRPFGNFFRHFALACINHRFDGSSRSVARPVRLISLSGSLNERAFLCGESTVASVKASCKEGFCKTPGTRVCLRRMIFRCGYGVGFGLFRGVAAPAPALSPASCFAPATSLSLDPTASTSLTVTSSFLMGLTAMILQTLGISVFSSRRPLNQASPSDRCDHQTRLQLLWRRCRRPEFESQIPQGVLRFHHVGPAQTVREVERTPCSWKRRRAGAGWLGTLHRGDYHEFCFVLFLLNFEPVGSELVAYQPGKLVGFDLVVHVEIRNNR